MKRCHKEGQIHSEQFDARFIYLKKFYDLHLYNACALGQVGARQINAVLSLYGGSSNINLIYISFSDPSDIKIT